MNEGGAIFDAGPGAVHRAVTRMIDDAIRPKPAWPRIVDEQYKGDPFLKLIECGGQHYVLDEAAFIESEERLFSEWKSWFRRSRPIIGRNDPAG